MPIAIQLHDVTSTGPHSSTDLGSYGSYPEPAQHCGCVVLAPFDQYGLLTRRQALDTLTASALRHRLRVGGPWQVVLPGIYASFTGGLTTHQRWIAGLLYGGPAGLLGGATAAALHGLRQLPASRTVHLLLPESVQRSESGFVRVRRTIVMPAPLFFDELRAVPVARAVVDACRRLRSLDEVRALVAESVQRGKTDVCALTAELDTGGSAGTALIRRVVAEVAGGAASAAEALGREVLLRSALPPARWNHDLFTHDGLWIACPDAWWPEAGVVLEIDSRKWHLLPEHWARTMARHALMTSHGLLVVHVTPGQFRQAPAGVVATLDRTIRQGMSRPTQAVTDVPPPGWRRRRP